MSFLRKHWHKVCFGILVLACGTFVTLHVDEREPESFAQLEADRQKLQDTLNAKRVSADYRYGDAALARLPQPLVRPAPVIPVLPARQVYLRPSKPGIDPASIIKGPEIVEKSTELPPLKELRTRAERGSIQVEFQLPTAVNMALQRADIYRAEGTDPHTLDTRLPFANVDLTTAKPVENWVRFADTYVEPKHAYVYAVKLVGAVHANRSEKDDAGHVLREIRYTAPKDALAVADDATHLLFAGQLSQIVPATALSNFEIKFSGTIGTVPLAGADSLAQNYTGRFQVRIWINDIQDWRETTVEVRPGARLAGKFFYKPTPKADAKAYAFDTGKVLEEIRRDSVARDATRHEQVTDPDGVPLLGDDNQPKTEAKKVRTSGIPIDVAVLKDSETGKTEELRK